MLLQLVPSTFTTEALFFKYMEITFDFAKCFTFR